MGNIAAILPAVAASDRQTRGNKRNQLEKRSFLQMISEVGGEQKAKDHKTELDKGNLKSRHKKKDEAVSAQKNGMVPVSGETGSIANESSNAIKVKSPDQNLEVDLKSRHKKKDEAVSAQKNGMVSLSAETGSIANEPSNAIKVKSPDQTRTEGLSSNGQAASLKNSASAEIKTTVLKSNKFDAEASATFNGETKGQQSLKTSDFVRPLKQNRAAGDDLTTDLAQQKRSAAKAASVHPSGTTTHSKKSGQLDNRLQTLKQYAVRNVDHEAERTAASVNDSIDETSLPNQKKNVSSQQDSGLDSEMKKVLLKENASDSSASVPSDSSSDSFLVTASADSAVQKGREFLSGSSGAWTPDKTDASFSNLKSALKQQTGQDEQPLVKSDKVLQQDQKPKILTTESGLTEQAPVALKQMNTLALWKSFQAAPAKNTNALVDQVKAQMQAWMGKTSFSQESNGVKSMTMTLYPEQLGQLTITVTQDKDGINARMITQTQAAKELLKSGIDQLQKDLAGHGVPVHHIDIARQPSETNAEDTQQHYQERQQSNQQDTRQQQNQQNQQRSAIQKIAEGVDGQSFKAIMSEGWPIIEY